jgi:chloramphenicol-sensitive protein RarD
MGAKDGMATQASGGDTAAGFGFAVSAYVIWGFLPLYMKALAHVPPPEVVAHRVLWSVPIAGAVLWATGRTGDLAAALGSRRTLGMAALTAALISVNWGVYVWAIGAGRAIDAALGYYINPLFSVLLGAVLLRERLDRWQIAAVLLAAVAVAVLAFERGSVPVVALGLTLTWGAYAYFKRSLPIGPNQGFLLEVAILSPFAALWLGVIGLRGDSHFFTGAAVDGWLLVGAGAVTAVPLILYAYGAKGLRLSTIGILQYVSPTMIFLTAVFLFDEPFGRSERIAFPMIWAALAVYTVSLVRRARAGARGAA